MLIPDTIKLLFALALLVAVVVGGAFLLATFPPEPSEIIRPLAHEKLRQG